MEKKRLEATHFIEVWKRQESNEVVATSVVEVGLLDYFLSASANRSNLKTICIFKIKFHNH